MWYFKKKDILEHFGKNEKDVRWLDRAIKRWQVIHVNGMYASRHDYDIERMIKMKNEIKELKEKSEWWDASVVRQLREDLAFQIEENERQKEEYEKEIDGILRRCYSHMMQNRCLPYPTEKEFRYWARGIDMSNMDSDFMD